MTNDNHIESLKQDYLGEVYKTTTYIQVIASSINNSNNPNELIDRVKLMQKHTGALYGLTNALFFSVQEVVERENETGA